MSRRAHPPNPLRMPLVVAALLAPLAFPAARARAQPMLDGGFTGYGGPQLRLTDIHGERGLLAGGPVMLFLDRHVGLGVTWSATPRSVAGWNLYYGGARAEYVLGSDEPVQISMATVAGGGSATERGLNGEWVTTSLYVLEPELTLSATLSRSLRIGIVGSYRWMSGTDDRSAGAPLSAPAIAVVLQHGVFGAPEQPPPDVQLSGYLAWKLARFAGDWALLEGAGTRLVVGPSFALGAVGYLSRRSATVQGRQTSLGYAGLEAEWTLWPESPLHVVVGAAAALGSARLVDALTGEATTTLAGFLEPSMLAELRLATFVRLALGASYRGAIGFERAPLARQDELGGPAIVGQLRFGWL